MNHQNHTDDSAELARVIAADLFNYRGYDVFSNNHRFDSDRSASLTMLNESTEREDDEGLDATYVRNIIEGQHQVGDDDGVRKRYAVN